MEEDIWSGRKRRAVWEKEKEKCWEGCFLLPPLETVDIVSTLTSKLLRIIGKTLTKARKTLTFPEDPFVSFFLGGRAGLRALETSDGICNGRHCNFQVRRQKGCS